MKIISIHQYNNSKTTLKRTQRKANYRNQKQHKQHKDQQNNDNEKTKRRRKAIVLIFLARTTEISHKKTWTLLGKGNLKRETESLLIATQNNIIRTNYVKEKIHKTQQNSKCSLCRDRHETIVHIRGAFKRFPDFFVQAFKIVVDSWQFSMLLLYILWDDWPIFMISGSN